MGINLQNLENGCNIWNFDKKFPLNGTNKLSWKTDPENSPTPQRIYFMIDNDIKWEIDKNYFSKKGNSSPSIKVEMDSECDLEFSLSNAMFPGTKISADLKFCLNGKISKIEFVSFLKKKEKLVFEIDLVKWLTGNEDAVSNLDFDGNALVCNLGPKRSQNGDDYYEGNVQIKKMNIQFLPNWQFHLKRNITNPDLPVRVNVNSWADDVGTQDGSGQQLVYSDSLQMFLLLPKHNSINTDPKQKRTLIKIPRNNESWSSKRVFPSIAKFRKGDDPAQFMFSKIESTDTMFDYLFIELGIDDTIPEEDDNREDTKQEVMLACSNQGGRGKIIFTPNFGSQNMPENSESEPFSLLFDKPAFAVDYVHRECCLVTSFCPHDKLLLIDKYAFRISNNIETEGVYKLIHTFQNSLDVNRGIYFICEIPIDGVITNVDDDVQLSPICKKNQKLTIVGNNSQFSNSLWITSDVIEGIRLSFPIEKLGVSRYKDLLSLMYEFKEFTFEAILGKVPKLIAKEPLSSTFKVKFCSPQHIAEKVFTGIINNNPPITSYSTGTSQLVFKFPQGNDKNYIELSADGLLNWENLEQVISTESLKVNSLKCETNDHQDNSTDNITLIECPWKLFISPIKEETWRNSWPTKKNFVFTEQQPKERGLPTYYELWHSSLSLSKKSTVKNLPSFEQKDKMKIKALDYHEHDALNFPTTLTTSDRRNIVRWTTDVNMPGRDEVQVNKLMLSSFGAWMDVYGVWDIDDQGKKIWIHNTKMGRDVYSRIVTDGTFTPFGFVGQHVRDMVRIVENKDGQSISYIKQIDFLNILEPFVDFSQYPKRSFPFKTIILEGEQSYSIKSPKIISPDGDTGYFYPLHPDGSKIKFKIVGIDTNNNRIHWEIPLIFTPKNANYDKNLKCAIKDYQRDKEGRTAKLNGQMLCYVKETPSTIDNLDNFFENTSFPTFDLVFNVQSEPVNRMPRPILDEEAASVVFPSIEKITGEKIEPKTIKYFPSYLIHGFQDSRKSLFLQLKDPISIKFSGADKTGGMATPDLNIHAMSYDFGPINAVINEENPKEIQEILDNFDQGSFNPKDFFGKDAKLLGYFDLFDIISGLNPSDQEREGKIPSLKTTKRGKSVISTYHWTPKLKITESPAFSGSGIQLTKLDGPDEPKLKITSTVEKIVDSKEKPSIEVTGIMQNFGISFLGFVTVNIEKLEFSRRPGKKMDLKVKFKSLDDKPTPLPLITFTHDILKLLNDLKNLLPGNIFDDGARIIPSLSGIDVGYTVPLPDIPMGALNLYNIIMDTELSLFFNNTPPKLGFSFGMPDKPFLAAVSVYAGGGYFNMVTSENGLEKLDARIYFGGASQMNIGGIAKGSILLLAGIQISKEITATGKSDITLTANLMASGTLDVLGLVTVSVLFDMGLSLKPLKPKNPITLLGKATVSVTIKMMFVKKRKNLSLEREFQFSSTNDLTADSIPISEEKKLLFKNMMTPGEWNTYSMAFA